MCCHYTIDLSSFNSYSNKVIMHYTELTTWHVVHKKTELLYNKYNFSYPANMKKIYLEYLMWKRDMQNKPVPPQRSNKHVCCQASATIAHKWLFFKTLYIECICEEVCRTLTDRKTHKEIIKAESAITESGESSFRYVHQNTVWLYQVLFTRRVVSDVHHHIGHPNFVCIMCIFFCSNVSDTILSPKWCQIFCKKQPFGFLNNLLLHTKSQQSNHCKLLSFAFLELTSKSYLCLMRIIMIIGLPVDPTDLGNMADYILQILHDSILKKNI